jgi:hypothetical protein
MRQHDVILGAARTRLAERAGGSALLAWRGPGVAMIIESEAGDASHEEMTP